MRQDVPLASAAAWSPTAAPAPKHESRILTLDDPSLLAPAAAAAPEPEEAAVAPTAPSVEPLAALREIARRLRTSPEADETLQFVLDTACRCTGAQAGMLTVQTSTPRQLVSGSALGAGPYISVPLRAGGPSVGEIVLTRLAGADEFATEQETFAELVAEYVAKAASASRAGTVLPQEAQDFVDRVTEEVRSPLAGIANVVSAALRASPPADVQRYLETAAADARRLLDGVEDLVVLAHLRPPEPRDMETIPVADWLERSVERLRDRARLRGVELSLRAPAEPHLVLGVPAQLDRVAAQLVGNAVKFTEPGGRIDVTAGLVEGMVRLTVQDTGIGFDQADASRMTELFARALTAEAARIPGMGVGLFVAAQIVSNHGGRLWLESSRDEGTQAHVALPPRPET